MCTYHELMEKPPSGREGGRGGGYSPYPFHHVTPAPHSQKIPAQVSES